MKKRLVVLCDGTWNRADAPAVTNVCKLREAVDDSEGAPVRQHVHYEPGVGTRRWERMRGGAFGVGLSRNVQECYTWLIDHYEPGDELFFFGFSRGAFTARSLGGLVRNSGILRHEYRGMVKEAQPEARGRPERAGRRGVPARALAPRRRDHLHRGLGHGRRPGHPDRPLPPAALEPALDVP